MKKAASIVTPTSTEGYTKFISLCVTPGKSSHSDAYGVVS